MAILHSKLPSVEQLIRKTVRSNTTIGYPPLFTACGTDKINDVMDTFEAACKNIAPVQDVILGAILQKKGTGLPGSGFFNTFYIQRQAEWANIAPGAADERYLSETQKKQMVESELKRIQAFHASNQL
ncbi:hypothetical protein AAFM71_07730 [Chromobacterium violaceum]|uniref:hypothetical protein n=1 Tax=Chromobacterium violaceum TaxID=536 RepID=UPI00385A82D5